jgi:hypothetical protein
LPATVESPANLIDRSLRSQDSAGKRLMGGPS